MQDDRSSQELSSDATLTPTSPPSPAGNKSAKPILQSEPSQDLLSSSGHSVYETPGEAPGFLFARARTAQSVPLSAAALHQPRDHSNKGPGSEEEKDYDVVGWDGPDDPKNPHNFSLTYKWALTLLVSLLTLNVTFASSAPASTTMAIAQQFGLTMVQANLLISVFLWGYVFGPFIFSASSEIYGRRPIFIVSFFGYFAFILGQPLARNPQTLLVTRFLSGVFASAPLTNSGGLIADIHDTVGKGLAMSVFTAAVFVGPSLGPIVGSYIVEGWRWEGVFWVLFAFAGVCWLLIVLLLPETLAPVLLSKKAQRLRKQDPEKYKNSYAEHEKKMAKSGTLAIIKRTLVTPFKILSKEVILILITIYLSIVYAVLYALFEAFPVIFTDVHGLSMGRASLPFLAVLVGSLCGAGLNVLFNRRYRFLQHLWQHHPPPEERLFGAILAGPTLVAGAFMLGWTGYKPSISVWGAIISAVPLGMAITLVFISLQAYIIDAYGANAASALAANTVCRSAVAGAFPLFTAVFFRGLGVQWAASIVGWVALVLAPVPLVFYLYGPRIRKYGSRYAPCTDLKVRAELEDQGFLPRDSYRALGGEARTGLAEARRQLREYRQQGKEGGQA